MLGTPIINSDARARTALASLIAAVRTTAQREGGNDRWNNGYLAGFLRALDLTDAIRLETFIQAWRILDAMDARACRRG
jgi:hypothetical protein